MQEIKLNAEKRDNAGKGVARKLRAAGKIPAVIYGPETESASLFVDHKDLIALLRKRRRPKDRGLAEVLSEGGVHWRLE